MEAIFINNKNSKTNKSHKFCYAFTDKPKLKNANENFALVVLSIYYTWKSTKSVCNKNNFETPAPKLNDKFSFPDESYSVLDKSDWFEYIIKKKKENFSR